MPAKSRSQQRLFQAAAHGATFPKAQQIRQSMTPSQIREFTPMRHDGKTEHSHRGNPGRKPIMRHGQ